MSDQSRIIFTIEDLLKWAWEETQMADALQSAESVIEIQPGTALADAIALHRRRSRWLDEQVAFKLDAVEADRAGQ